MTDQCSGCDCPMHRCAPLWSSQRKCCPDCSHTPVYPLNLFPQQLEPHFSKHMEAMTAERLDGKFEIAEQLAWRDQRIEFLWKLLDDIDSLGDQLKPELSQYFVAVNTIADRRRQILVSLDGHSLQPPAPGSDEFSKEVAQALEDLDDAIGSASPDGFTLGHQALTRLRALQLEQQSTITFLRRRLVILRG